MRNVTYHFIHRYLNPILPDSSVSTYFRWKAALALVGTEFHKENLQRRRAKLAKLFDPSLPLQPELSKLLPLGSGKPYRVLDVGAGPVSKVGKLLEGEPIDLVPIDPLADEYKRLLEDLDFKQPCPIRKGYGERLTESFPKNSFDLVHARNSIDHCLDPVAVISECVRVLKSGCYVYLNHYRNEGIAADYYGLHQWNFDVYKGDFVVSGRFGKKISINATLEGEASIRSVVVEGDRIIVVIRKNRA